MSAQRKPNFDNLLRVLHCEEPPRPTLFEFFLNEKLNERIIGPPEPAASGDPLAGLRRTMRVYHAVGYDYVTVHASDMAFVHGEQHKVRSVSQNEGALVTDRASFEAYPWPDPDAQDYSRLDVLARELPDGMRFVAYGPSGVLENAIGVVGYENICLMTLTDPELAQDVFDAIGSRLLRYYEIASSYPAVGAVIGNDDWGFQSQTVFPPENMRRFVFPWHKKIVQAIHAAGKPAILHSCGNLRQVMDDVIDDIGYDAKHSYEDSIQPIEKAYEEYHGRIALLGGIDVDFLCRSTPEEIRRRTRAMLERTAGRGAWAVGSGNSIPDYVPNESYLAMVSAVLDLA
jgi:uroporphyrinogen decarboxylase